MNNIGFEIITPKINIHYGANHDEIEIDSVEFLRSNMSHQDFHRFCRIVREYFCELGWGDPTPSELMWPPPNDLPPPPRKRKCNNKKYYRKQRKKGSHPRSNSYDR